MTNIAPDCVLHFRTNEEKRLSDFRNNYVILYFYPKDDTPGCTIEAQEFNQLKPEFDQLNAIIIGISKDTLKSHSKFKEKYCLNFDLATDVDLNICKQYGVLVEKSMMGKKYIGIERTTFLIDKEGIIVHSWHNVTAKGHAAEVLELLKLDTQKNKNLK